MCALRAGRGDSFAGMFRGGRRGTCACSSGLVLNEAVRGVADVIVALHICPGYSERAKAAVRAQQWQDVAVGMHQQVVVCGTHGRGLIGGGTTSALAHPLGNSSLGTLAAAECCGWATEHGQERAHIRRRLAP